VRTPRRRATFQNQVCNGRAAGCRLRTKLCAAWIQTARTSLRPCRVIDPCCSLSPLDRTVGTIPLYAVNCLALANRPIRSTAATKVRPLMIPTPGMVANRAIRSLTSERALSPYDLKDQPNRCVLVVSALFPPGGWSASTAHRLPSSLPARDADTRVVSWLPNLSTLRGPERNGLEA
jgi:hypothetical protein